MACVPSAQAAGTPLRPQETAAGRTGYTGEVYAAIYGSTRLDGADT